MLIEIIAINTSMPSGIGVNGTDASVFSVSSSVSSDVGLVSSSNAASTMRMSPFSAGGQ